MTWRHTLTWRHTFAISPRVFARGIHLFPALSNQRARGGRAPDAPDSRVCNVIGRSAHALVRSHRSHPALPAQWFTAYHALSPAIRPGVVTVIGGALTADLTPALRRQDHTLLPSASALFV